MPGTLLRVMLGLVRRGMVHVFSKTDVPKPRRLGQASCSMLRLATDHVVGSVGSHALAPRAHAPSSQRGPTAMRIGTWTCGGVDIHGWCKVKGDTHVLVS